MAVVFELWAECKDEVSLYNLKSHFDGLRYTLLTGRTIGFSTEITNVGVQGLIVSSFHLGSGYGVDTLKDALEATEAGIFLYHRLKTAPDFRFAHVGWDAENQDTSGDLLECVETMQDGRKHWSGFECVIDDELYKQLGAPIPFWQFREGYWWQKFRGESYTPLSSTDQKKLNELCEQLLPNNFDFSNGVR